MTPNDKAQALLLSVIAFATTIPLYSGGDHFIFARFFQCISFHSPTRPRSTIRSGMHHFGSAFHRHGEVKRRMLITAATLLRYLLYCKVDLV